MPERNVVIITGSDTLFSWCRRNLMHKFNIVRASFTEIMNFGVSIDTVLCLIIDPQGIPDELFYATFRYCSDILCIPSVVIMKSGWSSSFICSLEFSYTPFLLSIGDRFPHKMIKSFENCCSRFCPEIVFSRPLLSFESELSEFYSQIRFAFTTDHPVLLKGETGSGKEFTAELIHNNSSRKDNVFLPVSLPEINSELFSSAMFGTVRGAFTGAENSEGFFETAGNGTILLDEIADLSENAQLKLMHILDSLKFCRVGGRTPIELKARLMFATDADLSVLMEEKKFRSQLFYRISVIVVTVPPLRRHKADIPRLAVEFAGLDNKKISDGAIRRLCEYSWPGNIRQLKNTLRNASARTETDTIEEKHIIFFEG